MVVQCWPSPHTLFLTTNHTTTTKYNNLIRYPTKPPPKFSCSLTNTNIGIGVVDIAQVAHNKVLVAAAVSAAIGQLSKPFTSVILYGKDFDFRTAFQAGGFPSTHSSSVVAAATSLALERGFSDSIFGVTLVYAGLVMYDAQGVRREVGNHAKALNILLQKRQRNSVVSKDRDNPLPLSKKSSSLTSKSTKVPLLVTSDKETRQSNETVASSELAEDDYESSANIKFPLKESIGHTEVEVVAGALLGFLVSLAVYSIL
ncbi:hypothetical protein PTKIN_Ptkin14bG0071900 [Pterospermum kingtungense]